MFGFGAFDELAFGEADNSVAVPGFVLSPSTTHTLGAQTITATGTLTTWDASNPFSITVGGGFATLSNYVNLSATSATFTLTISSLGGTITVSDSNSSTTYNVSAAAAAPAAPTNVIVTDLGNGTLLVAFTPPTDNGGSAITSFGVSGGGFTASGASSPIIIASTPGTSTTISVTATNVVGTGSAGSASPITPARSVTAVFYTATTGNDNNTGLSLATAWLSATRVNAFTFIAGDDIRPGAGVTMGYVIQQSGAAGNYIVIGTGRLTPANAGTTRLAPSGQVTLSVPNNANGITVLNAEYVSIDNLILQGSGVNTSTGATTATGTGISFKVTNNLVTRLQSNRITACQVTGCKDGIWAWTEVATYLMYNDFQVWSCITNANQRVGFITFMYDPASPGFATGSKNLNTNFYVGYHQSYDQPGNSTDVAQGSGLDIRNTTTGTVEYSVSYAIDHNGYNAAIGGASGIGVSQSDAITVRFCEAYNIYAPNHIDGVGFDIDAGATNCITEYCYSHGNAGAGYYTGTLAGKATTGNVWRYCVAANNVTDITQGLGEFTKFNDIVGGVTGTIYNCTIYSANSDAFKIFGDAGTIDIYNTILVSKAAFKCVNGAVHSLIGNDYYALGGGTVVVISYNTLSELHTAGYEKVGSTLYGVIGNPSLSSTTTNPLVGTLPGANVSTITYFNPAASSGVVDAGVDLTASPFTFDIGTIDFRGNSPLSGAGYDVGAVELQKSFSLSPTFINATGVLGVTAIGVNTNWGVSDPFSVLSGPATEGNYANVSGTSATFDLTVSAVGTNVIIHDANSNSNFTLLGSGAIGLSAGPGLSPGPGQLGGVGLSIGSRGLSL